MPRKRPETPRLARRWIDHSRLQRADSRPAGRSPTVVYPGIAGGGSDHGPSQGPRRQSMSRRRRSLQIAWTLVSLAVVGAAQAQPYYSVTGGGGQSQIGDGLPLPAQDQISIMGGKNGTGGPIGTYTNFPPLLIPVNAKASKALIKQTAGADPKKMTIPPGVFRRIPTANGTTMGVPAPVRLGLAVNNPNVLQVRTTLSFSAPAKTPGAMTFMAGQRANNKTTYSGTPL